MARMLPNSPMYATRVSRSIIEFVAKCGEIRDKEEIEAQLETA